MRIYQTGDCLCSLSFTTSTEAKKKQPQPQSSGRGWGFNILKYVLPRRKNEVHLPDDGDKKVSWCQEGESMSAHENVNWKVLPNVFHTQVL